MDVCLSSAQQSLCLGEAPNSPGGWLEEEEGALQEDGTGGPPGGKLLFFTATAFLSCFPNNDIFKLTSAARISISF